MATTNIPPSETEETVGATTAAAAAAAAAEAVVLPQKFDFKLNHFNSRKYLFSDRFG